MTSKTERDWEIVKGAWQIALESNPSAADAVMQMLDQIRELRTKVDDLTNAATTAKNLLSRKHPHSVADVDGDAWEAWAVLEAALVSDKE